MKLLRMLSVEDRLIVVSMVITMGGIVLGALLAEPRAFGIDALIVMGLLIVGWYVTRSPRLAWLLPFGLVVGLLELWADWVHVTYFGSLVYTDHFGFRLLASRKTAIITRLPARTIVSADTSTGNSQPSERRNRCSMNFRWLKG